MTSINLDELKRWNLFLYSVVTKSIGHHSGIHTIDIGNLPLSQANRFSLSEWSLLQNQPAQPAEPQIDMAEVRREEQADMKRAADQQHAVLRLNEWAAAGLEDTQANADLIKNFIEKSDVHGYLSREIVDAAVANLGTKGTNQLTWKPKTAPAPPPPAPESAELLGTLPNGEPQLPLDVPPSRASKEQAKDWLARTRKATGKYSRPSGSWGSSF